MATTNHYDLIVLGNHLAGLVAAALVARRGKRVLVLPHGPVSGAYHLGQRAFALDTAPILHMGCPTVQRVFHELGLLHQVRREHEPIDTLSHTVLENHRLDLAPSGGNLAAELEREWPDDAVVGAWELRARWAEATNEVMDELLASDHALVADGFWGRRFLARVSGQLPTRDVDDLEPLDLLHPLRRAAHAIEPWLLHLDPAQLGKAASLRINDLWNKGPRDLPNGDRRIREVLLQRIALHSGEIKRELRVAEFQARRGRITGVSLLGKRDHYGCDHVIVATDPKELLDGPFTPEQLPTPLLATLDAIEPVAHRFVMHAEIEERGLSPAFDRLAICVPPHDETSRAAQSHGIGHTFVRVEPGTGESTRTLSITRIVGTDRGTQGLREEILADLDRWGVLPFARPYLSLVHSPHDDREASDQAMQSLSDLGPGSAMHLPMASLYRIRGEPSLGVGVLPHSSGIRNLYFASRLTLPGLGVEGEFAAGITAAGMVANVGRSPLSRAFLLRRA